MANGPKESSPQTSERRPAAKAVRLVDQERVQIEFLIDDLIKELVKDPNISANGCNGCSSCS
jgi:hypothetical protein